MFVDCVLNIFLTLATILLKTQSVVVRQIENEWYCRGDASFILFCISGGGDKKIASQKLEWKGQSKVGSIDNIKHRPGGGNIKVNSIRPF